MFLPVLLVRDYGVWGFVVFAVPNVIGAAAMGWVLRSPESSRVIVAKHAPMCRAFSFATIPFQVFFFAWAYQAIPPHAGQAGGGLVHGGIWALCLLVLVNSLRLPRTVVHSVAFGVLALSAVVIAYFLYAGQPSLPPIAQGAPSVDLAWLLPVCAFGFTMCPYLDLTFHRARLEAGSRARQAFTVGFAVFFPPMILLTLACSGLLHTLFLEEAPASQPWVALAVLGHIAAQLAFTVAVHLGEVAAGKPRAAFLYLAALIVFVLVVVVLMDSLRRSHVRPDHPELTYRVFMGLYGLAFPGYVWLCMVPTRDGHSGLDGPIGRRKLVVWAIAVALAAPAFWMGFIEREERWLAPGLIVVLLARLLIPGGAGFGRLPREPFGAPVPAPTRPPTLAAHAQPDRRPDGV